jgi:hypothetical protein
VLVIQDTTELDCTRHPATSGLGYLDHPTHQGLTVHSALAAPTDGVPLGLVDQFVWARAAAQMGKKRQRAKRAVTDKERQRWVTSLPVTQHAIPADCRVVVVADREAARSPLVAAARRAGVDVLIRAAQNRRVAADTRLLDDAIAAAPVRGTLTIDVPQRDERPARRAQSAIRWTSVRLCPPQHAKGRATLPHLPAPVAVAEEQTPPPGVAALRRVVVTTLDVTTWDDALQVVRWRRTRWLMERSHDVLKSGCRIERVHLETAERLQRALAVYCVVARRLVWLTYAARQDAEEAGTAV